MIVVSDTMPLITLMKVGRLSILNSLFGEVRIPEAVFSEATGNETFKDEAEIIRNSEYIRVVKVRDHRQVEFLQRVMGLDRGESEAIIYADENKADLLLMDDWRILLEEQGLTAPAPPVRWFQTIVCNLIRCLFGWF